MSEKPKKGEKSRQILIETAAELFLKNGYYHTSVNEILNACEMTKGSFYFYFSSKDELGAEVARYFKKNYLDWFGSCLDGAKSYEGFINRLIQSILDQIDEGTYLGCPFTCFATETAGQLPEVQKECETAIHEFQKIFVRAKRLDGISDAQAQKEGLRALAMYEGGLVCYRITQNRQTIQNMKNLLL